MTNHAFTDYLLFQLKRKNALDLLRKVKDKNFVLLWKCRSVFERKSLKNIFLRISNELSFLNNH